MRVELHLHTTAYSGCAIASPGQLMRKLTEEHYDAVYLTEHDAVWSDAELHTLRAHHPRLLIFPGMERSVGRAGASQHLLVLGTNDPSYLRMDSGEEIILRARAEGHLTVLAHPFRWEGGADLLEGSVLPDAMEFRTPNHAPEFAQRAREASERLGVPLVNSGDVHVVGSVGRFWIQTGRNLTDPDDIRDAILSGDYRNLEEDPARTRRVTY